jgi:hypothetical protein
MNGTTTLKGGQLLLKVGRVAVGVVFAPIGAFRELFTSVDVGQDDDRQLLDTDLTGEFNHRTGRLDAGNDPYGWYGED